MASPETLFSDFNESLFSDVDENSTETLFPDFDENFSGTSSPSSAGTYPSRDKYCYGDDDDFSHWGDDSWVKVGSFPTAFYVVLAVQIVAALVSVMAVTALLIPLVIQLKNGTFRERSSLQRRRRKDPPYSTYNLYMVYLALADLTDLLLTIATEIMALSGKSRYGGYSFIEVFLWDERFYYCSVEYYYPIDLSVGVPYAMANLWINAFIAYQVLILLRQSHSGVRITQPSLARVNLQGGGVFLFSIGCGIFFYYTPFWGNFYPLLVLALVPFSFVIGVTIWIQCRGYMSVESGSSPRDKAVRGLAFYFFRVTMVFVGVWLPVAVLWGYAWWHSEYLPTSPIIIATMMVAIQPILTFCMILTKPDVKKYVKDLVTLTYCRRRDDKEPSRITGLTNMVDPEDPERLCGLNAASQRASISLLGFTFDDIDTDCNTNVNDYDNIDVGTNRDDNVNGDENCNTNTNTNTKQDAKIGISPVLDSDVCGIAAMIVQDNTGNEDITSSVCEAEDLECQNTDTTALSFIKGEHQLGRILDIKYPEEEVVFDCNDDDEEVLAKETEESI